MRIALLLTAVLIVIFQFSFVTAQTREEVAMLLPVSVNNKIGYVSRSGKIIIQPQFKFGSDFSEGLARVRFDDNGDYGFIDKSGKVVVRMKAEIFSDFSEGLAQIRVCEAPVKKAFWDDNSQKEVERTDCQAGKLKSGFIDKTGKIVIEPKFSSAFGFIEGLASVEIDAKYGIIDRTGKFIIDSDFEIGEFSEGLADMKIGGKTGFIDKTGKIVIKPQFEQVSPFREGLAAASVEDEHGVDKFGFIDRSGKVVVPFVYDRANVFFEGLAPVLTGEKWGYINHKGELIIKPQFAVADNFREGLAVAAIKEGGKLGFIDGTGKFVIKPQWGDVWSFFHGVAAVSTEQFEDPDAKWGYINKKGKYIWRPTK